jgi:uncharacterized membrane protein
VKVRHLALKPLPYANSKTVTKLGTLGDADSAAYGINDAGQVMGDYWTVGGSPHAFIAGPMGRHAGPQFAG